jgi:hypothetical protein
MNFNQLQTALWTLVVKEIRRLHLATNLITTCNHHEFVLCDFW